MFFMVFTQGALPQSSPPHEFTQVWVHCGPVDAATQLTPPLCMRPQGLIVCLRVRPRPWMDEVRGVVNTQVRVTVAGQTGSGQAHLDTSEMGAQCEPA
ncbi:hypothetical protein M514_02473 [Trichuris suis]|uniref:Uncharacterized protein n=1 Tax=Trichuris suis TaxID=68888 RepID=A0A085NF96_9BILA|nr:hypothetical protein M513_02473 [Trichuris suis]KFD68142.1 hypothetical protein M514_02473 [Trichuris suis]